MKKNIITLAALLMASATFVACSSDDNIIEEQPVQPTEHVYTMTVNATKGGDAADSRSATTRALSLDGKTLNATWAEGERVTVYNETRGADLEGYLEAQSDGASTTLKGELTGTIENGDQLTLKFLSPAYNTQDGTLTGSATSIDKVCDYAEAPVTVASVADGNITTTGAASFQNRQAIVKFTLKNQDGNDLNVSNLTISAASKRLVSAGGSRGIGAKTYYTGYTATGGTGGTGDEGYDKLVDGNTGTKWCTNSKSDGVWYMEFNTSSAVLVDGYTLTTGGDTQDYSGRNPRNWVLKAKANSGDAWTVIDTKTGNTDMPAANHSSVDFETDVQGGTYQYFRLEVSAIQSGDWLQLSEMKLYGCAEREFSTRYGNVTVTPAAATNELTVALNNQSGAPDTYTLVANVGGADYSYTKSGVTFESGKYYAITVKMTKVVKTAADARAEDLGKFIGTDGIIYNTVWDAENAHIYAVAKICYVGSDNGESAPYNHGLALKMSNWGSGNWDGAVAACENYNTTDPVTGALWKLPSKVQWSLMISAAGGYAALRDCFGTGANMDKTYYWSSTEDGSSSAWEYDFHDGGGAWQSWSKSDPSFKVRAVLVF